VPSPLDIEVFLKRNEEKELLRFSTAGSVDDGKSTLIGRLLVDSKGVYEDQIASARKAAASRPESGLDFAMLTDGLRAEREQGITIDVAYRYFSTPRRKFIIADTPGHEQYTRNMATGASTVNLAIILVDARKGVLPQTRRHAFIASLLGIPHMVVAVNKMDLVEYGEAVFEQIRADFTQFAAQLQVNDLQFIPISAWLGDNVVEKSDRMPWFDGPCLLHHLETVHIASDRNLTEMRFPVQYVVRPSGDFRGYAGQVASGIVRKGDPVLALPSGAVSRVRSIVTRDGELEMAFTPMAVSLCLEDEIDISRGDMLVHPQHSPHVSRHVDARVVWMSPRPLSLSRAYLVKHTTRQAPARVSAVRYRIDIGTLEKVPCSELALNEIGAVMLETSRPLFFDPYRRNHATGSFILIDPDSNETVAAGMITGREPHGPGELLEGIEFETSRITTADRERRAGHRAATVWLGGNQEAAYLLETGLFQRGCLVHVLAEERYREVFANLARILNAAGLITICSGPALADAEYARLRERLGADRLLYLDASAMSPPEAATAAVRQLEESGFLRRTDQAQ
jgi:sulfate adenylyltransferase large subunit